MLNHDFNSFHVPRPALAVRTVFVKKEEKTPHGLPASIPLLLQVKSVAKAHCPPACRCLVFKAERQSDGE